MTQHTPDTDTQEIYDLQRRAAQILAGLLHADLPPLSWQLHAPRQVDLYTSGTPRQAMLRAWTPDRQVLHAWASRWGVPVTPDTPRTDVVTLHIAGLAVEIGAPAEGVTL